MKTLLFLSLITFLSACTADLSDEERRVEEQKEILKGTVEVLKNNEATIEDAIMFGSVCLLHVEKTGVPTGEACEMYYLAQSSAEYQSIEGVKLIFVLVQGGLLVKGTPYFTEILDIVERLAIIELEVKQISIKINNFTGSQCIKCAI